MLVVGAGTAGAATAALCAERGIDVLCLERGPLDRAGARWVNGVPAAAFDAAGIDRPSGAELRGGGDGFHLVAGHGPERVVMRDHGVLEVDMRHLVARLQRRAADAGAELAGEVAVRGREGHRVHTDRGTISARWIVDASGLAGARLLEAPRVPGEHLCAAAQQVRRVRDAGAAAAFFAAHGVPPGEVLCFTGIAGGFSILNVRWSGDHVSILTGSIPAAGFRSGRRILDDFVTAQPWIGEPIFGGARAIPLRRPFDRQTDGVVCLLGDAGAQVFPAHGSGIGPGLVAARTLADTLADGGDLHRYAQRWMRTHGALLAGYDLFRRFSQTLTVAELTRMMTRGLIDPELATSGMAQTWPRPPLRSLPGKARALAAEPRLAARLAAVAARMLAVRAHYAAYPRRPTALPRWSRTVASLFGDPADVVA
jgi:menaquinone-9 beta-reductase